MSLPLQIEDLKREDEDGARQLALGLFATQANHARLSCCASKPMPFWNLYGSTRDPFDLDSVSFEACTESKENARWWAVRMAPRRVIISKHHFLHLCSKDENQKY